jgi:hypothetical protein
LDRTAKEFAIRFFSLILLLLCSSLGIAQSSSSSTPAPVLAQHPGWPKAEPADVDTVEHTVHAFYKAISTPAGGKLDLVRLRSLFVPEGRIVVGLPARGERAADVMFLTPEEYVARSDAATATRGFFDRNPANQVERFGVMAHVYSLYESRARPEDATPMARGMKSFELVTSGGRWYIVQVYWDSERPENPIPEAYLHDREDGGKN